MQRSASLRERIENLRLRNLQAVENISVKRGRLFDKSVHSVYNLIERNRKEVHHAKRNGHPAGTGIYQADRF